MVLPASAVIQVSKPRIQVHMAPFVHTAGIRSSSRRVHRESAGGERAERSMQHSALETPTQQCPPSLQDTHMMSRCHAYMHTAVHTCSLVLVPLRMCQTGTTAANGTTPYTATHPLNPICAKHRRYIYTAGGRHYAPPQQMGHYVLLLCCLLNTPLVHT